MYEVHFADETQILLERVLCVLRKSFHRGTAPELPATDLAKRCYEDMFSNCESLTTAPVLPATTLAERCYYSMFYGCTSLSSITMLATDINATDCLMNWVKNVATSGTFTKAEAMTSLTTGVSGIPSGWTVKNN